MAALVCEPIPANMGIVPPEPGFLDFLRELASESGALLIFDEVITGFRVHRGGAQAMLEVRPDLTVMGKIVGGGLPLAAYGGRSELMERIAPAGDVYQAGTLSGNPLAVAAGLATLGELDAAAYERLRVLTDALAEALRDAAAGGPVAGRLGARAGDSVLQRRAGARLRRRRRLRPRRLRQRSAGRCSSAGSTRPPSQYEGWFVSLAHDEAAIETTASAAAEAFAEALG